MEHEVHALQPIVTLLMFGILGIILMRPLKLSPIVGYLLAGILIGPHGLGLITESDTTHLLAELGVVFLLFDIGMHFSLAHIWEARRDILGLGPVQVLLCTAVFAVLAMAAGFELDLAIVIGVTLALSSTAVVIQTLVERGQQSCPVGVTGTAVLIFQDICAIFLLILATSIGDSNISLGGALGLAAIKAAFAFIAAILIGHYVIEHLFRFLSKVRSEEIFTAVTLLIVLVTAMATGAMGLSLSLGAFLGGMIISETHYRHVIQTEIKPFRGLLLGFFFITVGMALDTEILLREWLQVLVVLALLVSIKTVFICCAELVLKAPLRSALQLGFLLSQGSEFAFVVFAMPSMSHALGAELSAVLITAVAASMILTPFLTNLGHKLATWLADRDYETQCGGGEAMSPSSQPAPVVIFGMDEIGRHVADGLEAHHIPYQAIEMDHDRFVRANADGYLVAFGDAADLRMMGTMDIAQRLSVVVTIKRYEVSRALAPIMRERYPNLTRYIAVENEEERLKFAELDMKAVINRSIPLGLDLAAAVLRDHGVSEDTIHEWMLRQQDLALEAADLLGEPA